MTLSRSLLFLLLTTSVAAETLPGFRVETIASVPGFATSVAIDSKGTLYCTTTDGWIHRVEGNSSVPVTALPTRSGGNGGLLGMALFDDATAAVHYTTWITVWEGERVFEDVVSTVDLTTGAETVLRRFPGDVEVPERGVSDEHHGGNPTVAPDGSIFVGIGDYGAYSPAQDPRWNGGKIWRIDREGNAEQYARGLRNPYDLAWDPELERIVVSDNGPKAGDEIHIVARGNNLGWPASFGYDPPLTGHVAPVYVWPTTVAPTGLARLAPERNAMLPRGYLSAAFVTRALYYFPDLVSPVPDPVAVLEGFDEFVIDVTQAPSGAIYFATASMKGTTGIHRLDVPPRGDCNGDGLADMRDIVPVMNEISDGGPHARITAQDGAHAGSWGCDANADGTIDEADYAATLRLVFTRRRASRS